MARKPLKDTYVFAIGGFVTIAIMSLGFAGFAVGLSHNDQVVAAGSIVVTMVSVLVGIPLTATLADRAYNRELKARLKSIPQPDPPYPMDDTREYLEVIAGPPV